MSKGKRKLLSLLATNKKFVDWEEEISYERKKIN